MSRRAALEVAKRIAQVTGARPEVIEAIDVCLAPLDRSAWPAIAWGFSRLTTSHFPVEFGFSTHEDRLRATFEVAGPETPDELRLDAALDLVASLGLPPPLEADVAAWRFLQAAGRLRWGCWLNLRQTARGFGAKLYLEVPRDGGGVTRAPGSRLHMLGCDLTRGTQESYLIWPRVGELEYGARLRALGAVDVEALTASLETITGLPIAAALGRGRLGVSRTVGQSGISLFVDSSVVRGGPMALKPRLMADRCGSYAALLGDRSGSELPDHGVLSLIPRPGGMELRASLAADALQ
jgi:hypothetical protein